MANENNDQAVDILKQQYRDAKRDLDAKRLANNEATRRADRTNADVVVSETQVNSLRESIRTLGGQVEDDDSEAADSGSGRVANRSLGTNSNVAETRGARSRPEPARTDGEGALATPATAPAGGATKPAPKTT